MRVLSLIHQPDAAAGSFAAVVEALGAELVEWNIARGPAPAPPESFDAVLVFGGSAHPDQDELHPWLREEVALLRRLVQDGVPLLGVCLGAETLARALGARVGPAPSPEIGWYEVELTREGEQDRVLGALTSRFTAFQWHSYAFDLPPGAVPLARSRAGLQAFRAGEVAWAVQFHPEVTEEIVAGWVADGEGDGPLPAWLGDRTAVELPRWAELGRGLCAAFLRTASGS